MHLDRGERVENIRHVLQLRPVELDVLARGEVAVALVPGLGDMGQHPHLARIERAVGDRNPQHVGVELQVEPVHQAQGLEFVLVQRAGQAAVHLVAELGDTLGDEAMVELVVSVHRFLLRSIRAIRYSREGGNLWIVVRSPPSRE